MAKHRIVYLLEQCKLTGVDGTRFRNKENEIGNKTMARQFLKHGKDVYFIRQD